MSEPGQTIAAVALGSNLGDRAAHLRFALEALSRLPSTRLVARSSCVQTDAVALPGSAPGAAGGPYLNAAAILSTGLAARELLTHLLAIERQAGRHRDRGNRWGPRTLDLDLLVHGDAVINEPDLMVPHPRLYERPFVLEPLAQIAPSLSIPPHGRTVRQLLADLGASVPGGHAAPGKGGRG